MIDGKIPRRSLEGHHMIKIETLSPVVNQLLVSPRSNRRVHRPVLAVEHPTPGPFQKASFIFMARQIDDRLVSVCASQSFNNISTSFEPAVFSFHRIEHDGPIFVSRE